MRRADLNDLVSMSKENMASIIRSSWGCEWNDETLIDTLMNPDVVTEVLEEKGNIAGYYSFQERGYSLLINSIQVSQDHRGQGYGRRMIERLERIARDRDMISIDLWVQNTNHEAIGFYKHMGYREVQSKDNNLLMRKDVEEAKDV